MSTNSGNSYRPDIDGLRALAILAVFLFHLDKDLLQGGFTGVDMFFVISGFLITSHIVNDFHSNNHFSFSKFYLRRIRRIIPALLGMVFFTIVVGSVIFTSYNFEKLGGQSFSAILSYSNIYFFLESGYFDDDSIFKPLLHTWSLGIEEQFYLIWPIILIVFMSKYTSNNIIWMIMSLGVFSFILNYVFFENREAIFYLMPFRIFEFSIGGTVSYLMLKDMDDQTGRIKEILSAIGLSMIVLPMLILNENYVFPFYNALSTTIGTAIVIYSRNTFVNRLLSIRVLVLIGLISYSLYLYHWPIIVFISYFSNGMLGYLDYFIIILLTLLCSLVSYRYIEKTVRFSQRKSVIPLLGMSMVILIGVSMLIKNGTISSMASYQREIISTSEFEKAQKNRYSLVNNGRKACSAKVLSESEKCNLKADVQVITMGNSHAIDAYNAFYPQLEKKDNVNLIHFRTTTGCGYKVVNDNIVSSSGKCTVQAEQLSDRGFVENVDVLIIHYFRFRTWGAGAIDLVDYLRGRNPDMKIVVLGAYLGLRPNKCFDLVNRFGLYGVCANTENITHTGEEDLDWILSQDFAKEKFLYIDSLLLLCGKSKKYSDCKIKLENGLIFYDGDHLSLEGAFLLGEAAFVYYDKELRDMGLK